MPHVHVLHYGVCLLTAAALVIITTLSTTPDSPHNQGNVHFPTYLHSLPALVSSKLTQKKSVKWLGLIINRLIFNRVR